MRLLHLRNERGTTLIQVLGASVILTAIVLAFVSVSQYTLLSNKDTDHREQALFIAEQIVNELRAGASYPHNTLVAYDSIYSYRIDQSLALPGGDQTIAADAAAGLRARNQLTLQTIVLSSTTPKLLTVNVTWRG
ncbi:type IV pilus modification PilV family protein [Cohnella fermenti]|uniref:Type II secretion system protein n=1 Tax=Cohnella fermenti TaxID=2565925 RepID=A0A4S4C4S0_9BACL|nr:hypothetical protein [Cohnella fermenti]THF82199.1 hypothetical protein E6C55_07400 [Cohnella fermenti]